MNIPTNTIIAWPDTEPLKMDRVISALPGGKLLLIPMEGRGGIYEAEKESIVAAVESGEAHLVGEDPETRKNVPEEEIPENHRIRRDSAWELIRPLVEDKAFTKVRTDRWKKITKRAQETGKPNKVIYDCLRKFWRGGQIKNALLPNFSKKRKFGVVKSGRKSSGLQLSAEVENKFALGIKNFFEKRSKATLRDAFQKTIAKYFNTGYTARNGVLIPIIPPESQLPTERQFRYWYQKNRNPEKALRSREGKRFELKHRAILGDSTQMGFGPGSLYQIDSTIGDIELVSSLDHSTNVGRPTLYIISDVFSRCITGFNLSLDDASYQQAALALENACEDKVALCARHGIDIETEEWPCQGLPEALLADRGELKGPIAENIVSGLGVRLDNTPPYRADLKGIVESTFRLGNQRLFHFLPGGVRKALERGDKNPRIDARLDILQLRKLVILWILEHNRRQLRDYPSNQFQVADGVELTPNSLWAWGIENRTGILKVMPPETVRTQLLPSGEAGITPKGIHFRKAFYTCPLAIQEQWFTRAREGKARKMKVVYDPRDVNVLYLRTAAGLERCNLKESNQKFEAKTWAEVQAYFYEQRLKGLKKTSDSLQREAEYQAQVQKIVVEAQDAFRPNSTSTAQRAKNLRENRRAEARRTKPSNLDEGTKPPTEEPDYIGPPSHLDILRRNK